MKTVPVIAKIILVVALIWLSAWILQWSAYMPSVERSSQAPSLWHPTEYRAIYWVIAALIFPTLAYIGSKGLGHPFGRSDDLAE